MYSFGFQLIKFLGIAVRFFLTLFCTFCGLRLFRQPEAASLPKFAAFFPCYKRNELVKYTCKVTYSVCLMILHCGARGYAEVYAG